MKKFLIINLLLILLLTNISTTYAINVTEILDSNNNVPAYEYYPTHLSSRGIKTLKGYDGKIFIGLGDWNDNTGPVKILYYDIAENKIKSSGTINDEAVQIFNIIDDKLYTTGCDPKAGWGYGSYYIYNNNENKWDEYQKPNGWIHVFNIVEFNNSLFMCGSTVATTKTSPIQYSLDDGETFKSIPILKNGELLPYNNSIRCYNLVSYNNNLYGFISSTDYPNANGIYIYDETSNQFSYLSRLPSNTSPAYGLSYIAFYNSIYINYEIFNNEFLYVSGVNLYKSTDLKTFSRISHNTKDVVQDSVVNGDTLYTLCYAYNSDKTFTARIYSTKDLENFNLMCEFNTDTPPFSLDYYDNSFYVGTNYGNDVVCKDSNKNGSLYRIDLNTDTDTDNNNSNNNNNDTNTDNGNNNNTSNDTNNTNCTNKLPQTGKFFEFKNLIQIILTFSVLTLTLLIVTYRKDKKE